MGGHFSLNTHYNLVCLPKESLALLALILDQKQDNRPRNKGKKTYREFQNHSTEMKRKVNLWKSLTLQTVKTIVERV